MAHLAKNAEADTRLGYAKLCGVLSRQRYWVLGISIGVLALTTPLTLRQPATYQSKMQLLVESNYRTPTRQTPDLASELVDSSVEIDYATQLNLMRSSELLQRVLNQLADSDPHLTVEDLRKALSLSQLEEDEIKTKIFEIAFAGDNPQKTQRVLEALQTVYLSYNLEKQQERLSRGLAVIDKQMPIAQQDLSRAQQALREFRQTYNLIDPNQQANEIAQDLAEIQRSRQELQADISATQSQLEAIQQRMDQRLDTALASARLSQSSRYQALLNELQAVDKELIAQRLIYQPSSLNVIVLQEKRQEILKLLSMEAERVLGSLEDPQIAPNADPLLAQGQYGEIDLAMIAEWLSAQTEREAQRSRDRTLAAIEVTLRQQLDQMPALINTYSRLQPEVETIRATIEQLLTARQALAVELAQGGFNWQVVERPQTGRKTGPDYKRSIILNGLAGFFLGSTAAFIKDALDRTLHSSEAVSAALAAALANLSDSGDHRATKGSLSVRLLGTLPRYSRPSQKEGSNLLDWPPFLEASVLIYKKIGLDIQTQFGSPNALKSLMVTSALPQEGKSSLAVALALGAHRMGERVLLVDANLNHPTLHQWFNLSNEKGLISALEQRDLATLPILRTASGLHVLAAGPAIADPLPLLASEMFAATLQHLSDCYERIILDGVPLVGQVEALQLACLCDGLCLVSRLDQVTEAALQAVAAELTPFRVIGLVTNSVPR